MASQPEVEQYDAGVYQLELTDPVQGGPGGLSNVPLLNLANRTKWLKARMDSLLAGTTIPPGFAALNSPNFVGSPTVPDIAAGNSSGLIPNTRFVQTRHHAFTYVTVPASGTVTLTAQQCGTGVLVFQGAMTGNVSVIFPNAEGYWEVANSTTGTGTLTLKTAADAGFVLPRGFKEPALCNGTDLFKAFTDFDNVNLTGWPTTSTPPAGDASTRVPTTAFVHGEVAAAQQGSAQTVQANYQPQSGVSVSRVLSFTAPTNGFVFAVAALNVAAIQQASILNEVQIVNAGVVIATQSDHTPNPMTQTTVAYVTKGSNIAVRHNVLPDGFNPAGFWNQVTQVVSYIFVPAP